MSKPLGHIVSVGARSPLGLNALQIAMCARARKYEPRACHLVDKRDRPIGICLTGGLHARLYGFDRMLGLAVPALLEAVEDQEFEAPPPVVLSLPAGGRPDDSPSFGGNFLEALEVRSGVPIAHISSEAVREGRAGMAHALSKAGTLLASGASRVIVGGVESYYHPGVLAWLDDAYRLHAMGVEDGFTPSEGAAFLVLSKSSSGAIGVVHSAATGKEHGPDDDEPNIGEAMTKLLAPLAGEEGIGWVMTDFNGERARAREWGMVGMRGTLANGARHDRPVEDLGDVGAASGALFIALACEQWRTQCAETNRVVVALHSDSGARGAIDVRAAS